MYHRLWQFHALYVISIGLLVISLSQASASTGPSAAFVVTKVADTNDGLCNADCSLREAVLAANAAPGADTILLPAGLYGLSLTGAMEDVGATGDLDITDPLTITGASSTTTVIDANGVDRVIDIHSSEVRLKHVTVQNGSLPLGSGGGIFIQDGALTLQHIRVINNSASEGTGIANINGTLVMTASIMERNFTSAGTGAAIYNTGTFTITDSLFDSNWALRWGGRMSGIFNSGKGLIANSTISGNIGYEIIYNNGGQMSLIESTIANNQSKSVFDAPPIRNDSGGILILKNTIVKNQVSYNCLGPVTSAGFNIDSGTSCGLTGPGDRSSTDPLLGPLQNNGGPTLTHALLLGSPAIDAGGSCGPNDQRGIPRPQGRACDIGAYEYNTPLRYWFLATIRRT